MEGSRTASPVTGRNFQPVSYAAHQRFLLRLVGDRGGHQSRRSPGYHLGTVLLPWPRLLRVPRDLLQQDIRREFSIDARHGEFRLRLHRRWLARRADRERKADVALREPA